MSKDNLTVLQGNANPNGFKEAVKTLKENFQAQVEFYEVMAKLRKANYDFMIKEGFTEAQALELCKSL